MLKHSLYFVINLHVSLLVDPRQLGALLCLRFKTFYSGLDLFAAELGPTHPFAADFFKFNAVALFMDGLLGQALLVS